jgi:hypothetical protein
LVREWVEDGYKSSMRKMRSKTTSELLRRLADDITKPIS